MFYMLTILLLCIRWHYTPYNMMVEPPVQSEMSKVSITVTKTQHNSYQQVKDHFYFYANNSICGMLCILKWLEQVYLVIVYMLI